MAESLGPGIRHQRDSDNVAGRVGWQSGRDGGARQSRGENRAVAPQVEARFRMEYRRSHLRNQKKRRSNDQARMTKQCSKLQFPNSRVSENPLCARELIR